MDAQVQMPNDEELSAQNWEAVVRAALAELNELFRGHDGFVRAFVARKEGRRLAVEVPDAEEAEGISCRWLPSLAMGMPQEWLGEPTERMASAGVEVEVLARGEVHGYFVGRPSGVFKTAIKDHLLEACFLAGFVVGQGQRRRFVFLDTGAPILPAKRRR